MGFEEKDYLALREIGMGDSAIYKMAGSSIVTTVLIGIFTQLFEEDKHIEIIKNYVDGLVERN